MKRKLTAGVLALACTMGATGAAHAKTTLKMATLAPKQSPWGKVFQALEKAVEQKTSGSVEVVWLYNGTAGPENGVVGKIKSGQLAGATITAVGLMAIHKPIVALQMPGVFDSWAELDAARDKLVPQFNQAAKDAGFVIGGWGDVGIAHTMSKGFPIRTPEDFRGKSPGMIRGDVIAPKVFEAIGGVTGRPGGITDFLPMLSNGTINILTTPAIAAEQLQWASRLDHINTSNTAFGIGASVFGGSQLEALSADERDIVLKVAEKASSALTTRIRAEDDAAFARLKKKMTVHNPSASEVAAFKKVFKSACSKVKGALPGNVLSQIGAC